MQQLHNYPKSKRWLDIFSNGDPSALATTMGKFVFIITLSILVSGTEGQRECSKDDDCIDNQYCYEISNLCVNYTRCSKYNRNEGLKPARRPNQCGVCIPGYSTEKNPNGESADSCNPVSTDPKIGILDQTSIGSTWPLVIAISVAILVFLGVGWCAKYVCQKRKMYCYKPQADPENPGILMLSDTIIDPSAPPFPPSENNNNYSDAEENLPLSSMSEHYGNIKTDHYTPVKALPFVSPNWVQSDPSYDPEGTNQVVPPTNRIMLPESAANDEETVPSSWRPTEQQAPVTVPSRPFYAINNEHDDNATNTALVNSRLYPSDSAGEDRENPSGGGAGAGEGERRRNHGASTSNSSNYNNGGEHPLFTTISNNNQININFIRLDNDCGKKN